MIIHIGYDVCVESEDVLCVLSPRTVSGPARHLLLAAQQRGAFADIPRFAKAACRAYLLLREPPSLRGHAEPPPLRLVASCLSPAALQRRIQDPNLFTGKDAE